MITRIEVWYSAEFRCWLVAIYNEENDQIVGAKDFYRKTDAVKYAHTLMPKMNIAKRNEATI